MLQWYLGQGEYINKTRHLFVDTMHSFHEILLTMAPLAAVWYTVVKWYLSSLVWLPNETDCLYCEFVVPNASYCGTVRTLRSKTRFSFFNCWKDWQTIEAVVNEKSGRVFPLHRCRWDRLRNVHTTAKLHLLWQDRNLLNHDLPEISWQKTRAADVLQEVMPYPCIGLVAQELHSMQ